MGFRITREKLKSKWTTITWIASLLQFLICVELHIYATLIN